MLNAALIITTYNWPESLRLMLQSVVAQSKTPDEVLVADDDIYETVIRLLINTLGNQKGSINLWIEDLGSADRHPGPVHRGVAVLSN